MSCDHSDQSTTLHLFFKNLKETSRRSSLWKQNDASVCTQLTRALLLDCVKMTGAGESNLTHLDHGTVLIFVPHWGLKTETLG